MDAVASRARQVGLAHSLLGALCSAVYLFPYKRAGSLSSPQVVAYALLIVAAMSNSGLYLWQRRSRPRAALDRRTFWVASALLSLLTISGNVCGAQAVARLAPAVLSVLLRTEIVFVGVFAAL